MSRGSEQFLDVWNNSSGRMLRNSGATGSLSSIVVTWPFLVRKELRYLLTTSRWEARNPRYRVATPLSKPEKGVRDETQLRTSPANLGSIRSERYSRRRPRDCKTQRLVRRTHVLP